MGSVIEKNECASNQKSLTSILSLSRKGEAEPSGASAEHVRLISRPPAVRVDRRLPGAVRLPLPNPLLCPHCRWRVRLSQRERRGED